MLNIIGFLSILGFVKRLFLVPALIISFIVMQEHKAHQRLSQFLFWESSCKGLS
jgi:hypothetical protein